MLLLHNQTPCYVEMVSDIQIVDTWDIVGHDTPYRNKVLAGGNVCIFTPTSS